MNAGDTQMVELPQDRFLLRSRLLSPSREQAFDDEGDLSPSSRVGHLDGFPLRRRALVGNSHCEDVDYGVPLGRNGPLKTREGERHPQDWGLPGAWRFPLLRETTTFPGSL